MILSRQVWAEATGRYAENPFNPTPVPDYRFLGGPLCIAVTGTQDQYVDFINCLAWVQHGSTPLLALAELRFLTERTCVIPHVRRVTPEGEVSLWYLPSVRVAPEVNQ